MIKSLTMQEVNKLSREVDKVYEYEKTVINKAGSFKLINEIKHSPLIDPDIVVVNKKSLEKINQKNDTFDNFLIEDEITKKLSVSDQLIIIKNKNENQEYFVERKNDLSQTNGNYLINILNSSDYIENNRQNLMTGLNLYSSNVSRKDERNLIINQVDTPTCYKNRYLAYDSTYNIETSNMEDGEKTLSSNYSQTNILRKYNINPYHNFNIAKKYFIYQLKKGFLEVKKLVINNLHMKNSDTNNTRSTNYHDIFTNYSQISNTNANSYIKYEDQNIQINNYYIHKNKLLGKGGFSYVYMCTDLKENREYAVKITDKKTRANAKMRKYDYVKEEVNILKRLYSRYIVRTYEIIETKRECLIIMELMKNNSLFSKINQLNDFKIWKYFRNLICGVEHCHEIAKIVHRDINVNNILISDDDILKLSDFGVSMIINEDSDLIPNSGPTTYIPPEKANKENTHYRGKSADVWCCGVTLYNMVYRKPLFKNFKNIENYKIVLPEDPYDLIDNSLKQLLLKLLDENPNLRYNFYDLKKNEWITKNGEFPLPDIHEEALEYVFNLTTKELRGIKEVQDSTI